MPERPITRMLAGAGTPTPLGDLKPIGAFSDEEREHTEEDIRGMHIDRRVYLSNGDEGGYEILDIDRSPKLFRASPGTYEAAMEYLPARKRTLTVGALVSYFDSLER
tara:strand:+ start:337 stop:657 length:321 start_codon:yes stop_codon:yes gene_type:complete